MSRKRKSQDSAKGVASANAAVLGAVPPGDWAALGDGTEVMVSWHERATTFVRRGKEAPDPMPSSTPVFAVRARRRAVVQADAVADPVGGSEIQPLFDDMPLLAKSAGGA